MSKRHDVVKSFGYAGNGVKEAFKYEPNFRIHIILGTISIILAFVFQFSITKWTILILTIAFVVILELVNTGIEKIVDILRPKYSPTAKVIKDVSAAAVLVAAIAAASIGILLFLPNILQLLSGASH